MGDLHRTDAGSVWPLRHRSDRSTWDYAVRWQAAADRVLLLGRCVATLMAVSSRWECTIQMVIEPDGDACETGHFVEIEIERDAVWADMSPWPSRFGGAIPHLLDVELGLAGWVLHRAGGDPDPIDCVCNTGCRERA